MARTLGFDYKGQELQFEIEKVDRRKLYGYIDTEARDEQDRLCQLVTLAGDGKTLIGSDGTAFGYITQSGEWRDKGSLIPVDTSGKEIIPVDSTFKMITSLDQTVSVDKYFEYTIRSLYLLETEADTRALLDELKNGKIYTFQFSYRGGLEADTAFLLTDQKGENIFMALGRATDIQFIGFEQTGSAPLEEDEEDVEDMDFSMM